MKKYLGFDFGASSGRAMFGTLKNEKLFLEEIHRFSNEPIRVMNSLYWNILTIYKEMIISLKKYVNNYGNKIDGIGIDTWGLDYVLLDHDNEVIGPIYSHRDRRTVGIYDEIYKITSREDIFKETGIQFIDVNTLPQLYSMVKKKKHILSSIKTFLTIPDYLNFLLTGVKTNEYSIATTTQLYNHETGDWSRKLIKKLGLNSQWFLEPISSGTVVGNLRTPIAKEVGLSQDTKIIAPLCHDTGSAVVAVPVDNKLYEKGEWAYISSGTWSLLGVELNKPIINDKSLKYNFTNEGGINKSIRFLKNITGMWLLQECIREWNNGGANLHWDALKNEIRKAESFKHFIYPNHPNFISPDSMISTIQEFCEKSGQKIPKTIGEISRTILESLAFNYREVLEKIEEITNKKIKILHIVGGGSQNEILNQFSANVINIPVIAGPKEATVIGNLLVQAIATKQVKDIVHLRRIVKNSFDITTFQPKNISIWNSAFEQYIKIINKVNKTK